MDIKVLFVSIAYNFEKRQLTFQIFFQTIEFFHVIDIVNTFWLIYSMAFLRYATCLER